MDEKTKRKINKLLTHNEQKKKYELNILLKT